MAEFKVIETQEEFDAMIKSRLDRAESKVRAEFADYETIKSNLSALQAEKESLAEQVSTLNGTISDLNAKLSAAEADSVKTRIALEKGLPYEMRNRLNGTNEEEILADAEALVALFNNNNPRNLPKFNSDPKISENEAKNAALKALSESLK